MKTTNDNIKKIARKEIEELSSEDYLKKIKGRAINDLDRLFAIWAYQSRHN